MTNIARLSTENLETLHVSSAWVAVIIEKENKKKMEESAGERGKRMMEESGGERGKRMMEESGGERGKRKKKKKMGEEEAKLSRNKKKKMREEAEVSRNMTMSPKLSQMSIQQNGTICKKHVYAMKNIG